MAEPQPPPDADDFGPTWILLRALPSDIPARIRFRSALKALLRQWRLKCDGIQTKAPEANGTGQG